MVVGLMSIYYGEIVLIKARSLFRTVQYIEEVFIGSMITISARLSISHKRLSIEPA